MSENQLIFDLNDLENDLLESTSNFDLESLSGLEDGYMASSNSSEKGSNRKVPTLESILNEEDDDFNGDEILRSFQAFSFKPTVTHQVTK